MHQDSDLPVLLFVCYGIVNLASRVVPRAERDTWRRQWEAELWHRRQFLVHAGEWKAKEAFALILRAFASLPEAAALFVEQDAVRGPVREWARSPWATLAVLGVVLFALGIGSSGFRATRGIFQFQQDDRSGRVAYIWRHSVIRGGDRLLPEEVAFAWGKDAKTLAGAAAFTVRRSRISAEGLTRPETLIIDAEPDFFKVVPTRAALGKLPTESEAVLTQSFWREYFHSDASVVGRKMDIGSGLYRIAGVLPASYHFLSFQPAIYVVGQHAPLARMMVVARVRPSVSQFELNRDLVRVAEADCYYFYRGELRYSFLTHQLWTPARMFSIAVAVWTVLFLAVSGVKWRRLRAEFSKAHRRSSLRRTVFFIAKTGLALLCVFIAGLECSRSKDAILFGARDPGCGPVLLWLYILGVMATFIWAVADQRARCRVCLRLLAFPVRMGSPGSLFLGWAGTELLCTEGHGLLHVPDLVASWEEEPDRWINLDDSWKGLFADAK